MCPVRQHTLYGCLTAWVKDLQECQLALIGQPLRLSTLDDNNNNSNNNNNNNMDNNNNNNNSNKHVFVRIVGI